MSAQVFHPSVFMIEEMEARGWSRDDLATAMMSADDDNWGVHRIAIDFYFDVGPTDTHLRMGADGAAAYGRAFGVSSELFLNLESAWLAGTEGQE